MDSFFINFTWLGSLYILLPLSVMLCGVSFFYRKGMAGIFLLLSLAGASLITHLLKIIIARSRPVSEDVLVAMPTDYSFPSAHTTQATAFFVALCFLAARKFKQPVLSAIWLAFVGLAGLVGYSRVYLQVHFITDVIGGAIIGVFWVLFLVRIFRTL